MEQRENDIRAKSRKNSIIPKVSGLIQIQQDEDYKKKSHAAIKVQLKTRIKGGVAVPAYMEEKVTGRSSKMSKNSRTSRATRTSRSKKSSPSPPGASQQSKILHDLKNFETFDKNISQKLTLQVRDSFAKFIESQPSISQRFHRTVLPIEQNCQLGGAIIGKKTVKQQYIERKALKDGLMKADPLKMLKQIQKVEDDLSKLETDKDPKSHDWKRIRRNIENEKFATTSIFDRLSCHSNRRTRLAS